MAHEILTYLATRPKAQDTLDGIEQWWLLERHIERHSDLVRQAVDTLVEQGWLVENKGKDAQSRYRLNPERREEPKAWIERQGQS
jgi:hypothetical protein